MVMSAAEIYDRKPAWVSTGIILCEEAVVLDEIIREHRSKFIVEIGTASGTSTAILASAADAGRDGWQIHTVDMMERCYFDDSKIVGQAAIEMFGPTSKIVFHRSTTAFDLANILGDSIVDFAFIDASHSSPWAAIDLLSIVPNLKRGAIIALHDLLLPFREGYSHQNAARDLFRVWRGQKWIDPRAPNLGLIRYSDERQALGDISACLQGDWDVAHDDRLISDLSKLNWIFDRTPFPGRDSFRQLFTQCTPEVLHANQFVIPARYPFAQASAVHPNEDDEALQVIWHRLPVSGAARLNFLASAHNESPANPGAEIIIGVSDSLEMKPISYLLRPRRQVPVEIDVSGRQTIDLCMTVRAAPDRTSAYSGVHISPFCLDW